MYKLFYCLQEDSTLKDINGSYEVETISYVKTRRHVRMLVFNYVFIFLHTGLHRLLHKAYFFLTI